MTNDFSFQNTTKIHFGRGALDHLGAEVKAASDKALLVYGGNAPKATGVLDRVVGLLEDAGIEVFHLDGVEPNPSHLTVNKGAAICRENGIGAVVAIGGGSAIDTAKGVAVCAGTEGVDDVWELCDRSRPITGALKIFPIVTLAATGSEMDSSAVISNYELNIKGGVAGPFCRPTCSFLNPELTFTVPRYQTACGSYDIMCHTLDTKYFSRDDKMDMLYRMMDEHVKTVYKWAPVALEEPDNYEARENLMWAATWGLNSFMTCGVRQGASAHPMEHEISAYYPKVTHGHGLAILVPRWLEYILTDETAGQIARLATHGFGLPDAGSDMANAQAAIDELKRFAFEVLGLAPRLSDLGVTDEFFAEMAAHACGPTGVINGFVPLTPEDVEKIYRMCL